MERIQRGSFSFGSNENQFAQQYNLFWATYFAGYVF